MALIIREKLVMTFLPKTGSCWIEQVIKKIFPAKEVVDLKAPGWSEKHLSLLIFSKKYSTSITVRNPVEWHKSWWAFNFELIEQGINGWHNYKYLNDPDFATHIDKVLGSIPNFYSTKINMLLGGIHNKIDFVIRQEKIEQDLIDALNGGLNETLTVDDIPKIPRILVTKKEFKDSAIYREDQPAKITEANKDMVEFLYGKTT